VDNGITFTFFLRPYHSDLEGIQKTDAVVFCPTIHNRSTCDIGFTYSTKMSQLAPPPYDTNCRDYRKMGFTSNENCLSSCLSNFTEKHGYIVENNVIPREKYGNSSLRVLHWMFRDLKGDNITVTENALRFEINRTKDATFREVLKTWANLHPAYEKHHNHCKSLCGRQDCKRESLVPKVLLTRVGEKHSPKLKYLIIRVYPSDDETVIVTSQPQLTTLDLIVYILSTVSFWFGFCPLSMSDGLLSFKSSTINITSRLSQRVHSLNNRFNNLITSLRNRRIGRVRPLNPKQRRCIQRQQSF
jgi:hypothetical protein